MPKPKPTPTTPSKAPLKSAPAPPVQSHAIRETVESIVIAFVLAFLFRTFEAEAFVIPTGSMAPTLYGNHKDVVCSQCGFFYEVNASEEADEGAVKERDSLDKLDKDIANLEARLRDESLSPEERVETDGELNELRSERD